MPRVPYAARRMRLNTRSSSPGVIVVLDKAKAKDRRGKLFLLNAKNEFTKGEPKNYLTDEAIARIAGTFNAWKEIDKYSCIVKGDEIAKNDFNISPSRYIRTEEDEEHRPVREIMEELELLEDDARIADAAFKKIFAKLSIS
jgi:type I restriction enzyme M protein